MEPDRTAALGGTRAVEKGHKLTATTWIGTAKALYRMARQGGDDWDRLTESLPRDQRDELSRLNLAVEALTAELKDAKEVGLGIADRDRQRLEEPWEEARQTALDPPEAFVLAIELVALLHAEPTRKYATKELAPRLDTEVGSQTFREAVELAVRAGFA